MKTDANLTECRRDALGAERKAAQAAAASVVSHAKLYIWFGTCYAVWHGSKQHGTGDNG